jgi:hypothetical protein
MIAEVSKDEILSRMSAHLEYHNGSEVVNLIWKGYLAALMESGLLQVDDYHELNNKLLSVGEAERRELFLGCPGQYE